MEVGRIVSPARNRDPQTIPLNNGNVVLIFLNGQVEIIHIARGTMVTIDRRGNVSELLFNAPEGLYRKEV